MLTKLSISRANEDDPSLRYVAASFSGFWVLNYALFQSRNLFGPGSVTRDSRLEWKWRNTLVSFIHSSLTGIWAPLTFYFDPGMSNNLVSSFNDSVHALISVSLGYFLYDFLDMSLTGRRDRNIYRLLLHHFAVIFCFSLAISTKEFLPYAALSLFIEINSIFLHARQLLLIYGCSRSSPRYRVVALINVATFVAFRIVLIGWMSRWLAMHADRVPFITGIVAAITLAIIVWLNLLLFYRILVSDFIAQGKTSSAPFIVSSAKSSSLNK